MLITVLREQFSEVIPAYDGIGFEADANRAALAAFMETHRTDWIEVPAAKEQPGDGILLRMMGHPIHVAVVVAKSWMLHIDGDIDACREETCRQDSVDDRARSTGKVGATAPYCAVGPNRQAGANCFRDFDSLRRIMFRFNDDRWSTNSVPSKWSISCWMHRASRPSASCSHG